MKEKQNTPGKWLQSAREAKSLQLADVAKEMRLSVQAVTDIENDNYASIGVRTFARGYLATYARIVEVSQPEILALFDSMEVLPEQTTLQHAIVEGAPVTDVTRDYSGIRYSPKMLFGAAGFVLLLGLMMHFGAKSSSDGIKKSDVIKPLASSLQPIEITAATNNSLAESAPQPAAVAAVAPAAPAQQALPSVAATPASTSTIVTAAPASSTTNVASNAPFVKKAKPRAHKHPSEFTVSSVSSDAPTETPQEAQ